MMATSLFLMFDPSCGYDAAPLNWLCLILGVGLVPATMWAGGTRYSFAYRFVGRRMMQEFSAIALGGGGWNLFIFSVGLFIFSNNVLGLLIYIFTGTSHLSITLSLAVPAWVAFWLRGLVRNLTQLFSHLIPAGTPPPLVMFMVLIETVSFLVRPVTLAVRLAANMIAGHLLLALAGGVVESGSVVAGVVGQTLLMGLESAVAVIQAYVFTLLITMYMSEVPSRK